jgi:TetR/AcrR family transcriptional regulator, transcriptional repressor for nem operon
MLSNVPNGLKGKARAPRRGRPRGFDVLEVVEAAKDLFWEHGYEGSTLADLERATRLNRSSLYQAFGTKEALFAAALDSYIDSFMAPRLAAMDRPRAGPRDVIAFFRGLAKLFREDPRRWTRGCLWVNSFAEFSGRELPDSRALEYRSRLGGAFANALSGAAEDLSPSAALMQRRGRMLTAATFGVWLSARVDPTEAARICDDLVAEVRSWDGPGAAGRR